MTRTVSPGRKRVLITILDFPHLHRELRARNEAALDHGLPQRDDPALVIAQRIVRLRRKRLDRASALVDGEPALASQEHRHGVHAPFPLRVVMLVAVALACGQSTHVVMATHAFVPRPSSRRAPRW